jgi:hypothetical protein
VFDEVAAAAVGGAVAARRLPRCGPNWSSRSNTLLRQVVYQGLREDKPAAEVRPALFTLGKILIEFYPPCVPSRACARDTGRHAGRLFYRELSPRLGM